MPDSLAAQIIAAAKCLERLQGLGPAVMKEAYSPRDLRMIARLFNGEGER